MLYRPNKNKKNVEVDLSPLIDVVFLLLIFFMVSTRFRDDAGMDLALPTSQSRQKAKGEFLTVLVDKNDQLRVHDQTLKLADLNAYIQKHLGDHDTKMVVLKVDKTVDHGTVVEIMDAAKKAGAEGITFATAAQTSHQKP